MSIQPTRFDLTTKFNQLLNRMSGESPNTDYKMAILSKKTLKNLSIEIENYLNRISAKIVELDRQITQIEGGYPALSKTTFNNLLSYKDNSLELIVKKVEEKESISELLSQIQDNLESHSTPLFKAGFYSLEELESKTDQISETNNSKSNDRKRKLEQENFFNMKNEKKIKSNPTFQDENLSLGYSRFEINSFQKENLESLLQSAIQNSANNENYSKILSFELKQIQKLNQSKTKNNQSTSSYSLADYIKTEKIRENNEKEAQKAAAAALKAEELARIQKPLPTIKISLPTAPSTESLKDPAVPEPTRFIFKVGEKVPSPTSTTKITLKITPPENLS